jgi:hypothetical protein
VDQVEQSLKNSPLQEIGAPAAPAPETTAPAAAEATEEKSDADLVAEFEKMLNG